MRIDQIYTLTVEVREGKKGIWLCLDDGKKSIPIARFTSEQAAEKYRQATNLAFAKAHQMGRAGI